MTYGEGGPEALFGAGATQNFQQGGAQEYGDPNAGLAAFQNQGVPQSGQYGYDPSLDQQGGQMGQGFFPQAGALSQPFQQPQAPQFQQPQPQYNPAQQAYEQMFQPQPQFGQPPFGQPQFGQPNAPQQLPPQFQQPQPQAQFQPQFQQPTQPYAPQPQPQPYYGQPQQPTQPYSPYAQQPQGYNPAQQYAPTPQYGQGYGQQQYANQTPPQQQAQYDPTEPIKGQITELENKYAAASAALNNAMVQNDVQSIGALAGEQARLQSQLTASYVTLQATESQFAQQTLYGVQQEYTTAMVNMLQNTLGYVPQQQDLLEFQQYLNVIMTPQSAAAMREPLVQNMVIKSYALDKMMNTRARGQTPQAPRDYVPNVSGGGYGGGNNFGQQQPQGQGFSFANLDGNQALSFLSSGQVAPRRG